MPHKRMTKEEKHWQAEGDAHTLARAQEVQGDPKRMSAAKRIAVEQAKELQKQTRAMQNVARKKTPTAANPARKAAKKTTVRKATGRGASKATRRKR